MYDELARIEGIYGSVAEYNRVRYEEQSEEPTPEQLEESERQLAVYNEKIRLLDGTPSQFVVELVKEWELKKPKKEDYKEYNDFVRAGHYFANERTLSMIAKLAEYHGVKVDEYWDTFYRPDDNHFAISVDYTDYGQIKHKYVGNLVYEKFKLVYCDVWYAGLWPSMSFRKGDERPVILSNSSLGSLRLSDLRWNGYESEESINRELKELGFNEEEFLEKNFKMSVF